MNCSRYLIKTIQIYVQKRWLSRLIELDDRCVLELKGSTAGHLLNSLMSNQVSSKNGGLVFTTFLNSKSRTVSDAFVWTKSENNYLIDCNISVAPVLERHLSLYFLREPLKLVPKDVCVASLLSSNPDREYNDKMEMCQRDPRSEYMGFRLVIPTTGHNSSLLYHYHVYRILLGISEIGIDASPGKITPFEGNFDLTNGIDFRKGCYLGQELITRTRHVGVVRKRLFPVRIEPIDSNKDIQEKAMEHLNIISSDLPDRLQITSLTDFPFGLSQQDGFNSIYSVRESDGDICYYGLLKTGTDMKEIQLQSCKIIPLKSTSTIWRKWSDE